MWNYSMEKKFYATNLAKKPSPRKTVHAAEQSRVTLHLTVSQSICLGADPTLVL
jgi:hypothetical protein